MLQAFRFALDPTPAQVRALASHCGAARKAFNEALAQVRRCLDQRDAERSYGVSGDLLTEVPWTLPTLRRWWNLHKGELAPWWAENSKEAYSSGLDALARGLKQWSDSRSGKRRGARVGFPRFKSRRQARLSCRFTTGAIRVEDATHVVLPRIGRIHIHESATALLGKVTAGQARILAATASFDGRRWYCSFTVGAASPGPARACGPGSVPPGDRRRPGCAGLAGGRRGGRHCDREGARTQAAGGGAGPAAGPAAQNGPAGLPDRRTGQRASHRWRRTQARIRRVHGRAADLRRDTLHKATTALAQRHQVIVVEDLNVTGMSRRKPGAGRGGRGLNRAIADAAMAEVRRQLAYKSTWYGARLVVAGRWYPSSKTCSACGVVKAKLALAERNWTCEGCGTRHDREVNAAINLARLSEHALGVEGRPAGTGPVAGRGAIRKTSSPPGAVAGGEEASTSHGGPPAAAGQTGTAPLQREAA